MLFMIVSRAKPGMNREQLVERLNHQVHPHVLYKVGDEPGFFALLNAATIEDAKSLLAGSASRLEAFDIEVYPVKQFPHFD